MNKNNNNIMEQTMCKMQCCKMKTTGNDKTGKKIDGLSKIVENHDAILVS